ncbi:lysylphosphatidylglycerol synthase transmembrane domain-containing protein [Isoptericola croceus]|uniref:lysylphosphatidylglycerol synthase transmembrane domain-containing protein n=1 Tax=Isoptericola croceus TaxID=3031406 RepID=UPI0023F8D298|nr:lysylphosphatidylglycerol synthase transmembrane domain-containing protein [Isoptericola croceus]
MSRAREEAPASPDAPRPVVHDVSSFVPDGSRPPTGALRALFLSESQPDRNAGLVRVVDNPEQRVRNPADLLGLVLSALGVTLVLVLSVVAHGTTEGVTQDVRAFNTLLGQLLEIPVALLEGLVTLIVPVAVLLELGMRRLGRQVVESIAAAALGLILGVLALLAIARLGSDELVRTLSVLRNGSWTITVPGYVSAIAGLLTTAGPRTRRRTVRWSWNLLYAALVVALITGQAALPGVLVALLLGRLAGQAVQYASGVRSERAYGGDLVTAVRHAGFRPTALVRVRGVSAQVDDDGTGGPATGPGAALPDDTVTHVDAAGEVTGRTTLRAMLRHRGRPGARGSRGEPGDPPEIPSSGALADPAAVALIRAGDTRVYAMFTPDGDRRDVVVLDGDRHVLGMLARAWRALRLRGLEGRAQVSLKAVAERTALLTYAATAAGVRTPHLLGVGEAADSIVLVTEHAEGAVSWRDLPDEELVGEQGDQILAAAWEQLRRAHAAGLTHHALNPDVLLVGRGDDGPRVWLTGWEQGEIASTTLGRRLDLTQMLALLALRVGASRAVASAVRALPDSDVTAVGPLLQSVALPAPTRVAVRQRKGLLDELRGALVERLPQVDVQPQNITRFGARTVIMLTLFIVVITALVTTMNLDEITAAVGQANPWWIVVAFCLGAVTWFGAALTFVAFSPKRLPLWRATLTQMAGSFVSLAAPAGIGPAALNLRMLNRRGVAMPMAVTTVALVQASQFVVTVLLLVVLSIFTGSGGLIELPSITVLLAIAGVALVVIATLLVPAVRRWAWEKTRPTLEQVWPRLSQMLGQPGRLAVGIGGNVVMSLGYVLAFDASLAAFGQSLRLIDVAVIYLVGNALGALIPTPGGLGGVEAALTAGLTAAGIPASIALSTTILFRLVTYWGRVPFGWMAMRYLERKGDL